LHHNFIFRTETDFLLSGDGMFAIVKNAPNLMPHTDFFPYKILRSETLF